MKKIFSKIIIFSILLTFLIPITFSFKNVEAVNDWYFTQTNKIWVKTTPGGTTFIKATSLLECTTKRNAVDATNYILGPCTENIQAPTGEGWGYNVTMVVGQTATNNPIGFKTEEDCNINRDNFLTVTYPSKMDLITGVDPCIYKKGISNNGVVNVTGKQIAAGDKYDPIYHLLAPIGNFTEIKTDDIGGYFSKIFLIAIGLCGALAVIMFVIGGIEYMGEESIWGKAKGKEQMTGAILGLLIALGSWALLNTINPDLLGGSGLLISSAKIELEAETIPQTDYQKGDNTTACPGGFQDVPTGATPANINVCGIIATRLSNMIAAAKASTPSIILSGSGSRSSATTQALRVQNNCPNPTDKCHPNAVALAGASNHEKGLAIDFNCNGNSMTPDKTNKNNVCYVWLSKHASEWGFSNNFSKLNETWHWSTTGT